VNPQFRRLASEAVIALSLCVGAHFFIVAPAQHELVETVSQISKVEAAQRAGEPLSISLTSDQAVRMSEEARQITAAVSRFSLPASDDAALFQAVTALAEGNKVRIDQLQPSPRVANVTSTVPSDPGLPPPPADTSVRCEISAAGEYSSVAAFLADLTHTLGFTSISSVRIEPDPAGGPGGVTARIQTHHHWFDTTGVLPASKPPAHSAPNR